MDHRVRIPQVIGHEMSGTVAELGPGVDGYEIGGPVVVRPLDTRAETAADKGFSHICRGLKFLGIDTPGAFQSSWTVPAFTLHRLPPTVDLRLAALVEPLAVACHDVRRGEVVSDESVVVIGGGPIGLLVGLVARAEGAEVTLSEVSSFRRGLAAELGLDVIDPTATDPQTAILERTGGAGADVVFEVSGSAAGADVDDGASPASAAVSSSSRSSPSRSRCGCSTSSGKSCACSVRGCTSRRTTRGRSISSRRVCCRSNV